MSLQLADRNAWIQVDFSSHPTAHSLARSQSSSNSPITTRITTTISYNATGKVRRMAKNIGFRMELLGTPKVRLGVPAQRFPMERRVEALIFPNKTT